LILPAHVDRQLEMTLDLGFIREGVLDCYATRGHP